jgi:hypothetical protein
VDPAGTITTIAGTGRIGSSGDGGPATSAQLGWPYGVAVDGKGNVYIAEEEANRVRKVSPAGTITTIAGGGPATGDGGPATAAQVRSPHGVAVDGQGNVYIAEYPSHRVRMVSPGGTITTIAGTGAGGHSGDGGPATSAQLYAPWGLAVDGQGNVYIGEYGNRTVRKVARASVVPAVTLTLGGAPTQPLLAQKSITITARGDMPCALSATGTVTILGTRYTFALTRATARLNDGMRTLTLRFPTAAQKRFRHLLKAGQRARATITVKATDKAGKTVSSMRTVTVRK